MRLLLMCVRMLLQQDPDTLELLGHFLSHELDYDEAAETYTRCIVPTLRRPRCLLYRGNIHLARGRFEEALADYTAYAFILARLCLCENGVMCVMHCAHTPPSLLALLREYLHTTPGALAD